MCLRRQIAKKGRRSRNLGGGRRRPGFDCHQYRGVSANRQYVRHTWYNLQGLRPDRNLRHPVFAPDFVYADADDGIFDTP